MITVVFGAGASTDAVSIESSYARSDCKPPLAQDLFSNSPIFENIQRDYDILDLAYDIDLRVKNGNANLELLLEAYDKNPKLNQKMIGVRFYLRDLFRKLSDEFLVYPESSNYASLARFFLHNSEENVNFVTFNYDTLLEKALAKVFDRDYLSFGDYIDVENYKLFKLHGSCNWGYPLSPQQLRKKRVTNQDLFNFAKHNTVQAGFEQITIEFLNEASTGILFLNAESDDFQQSEYFPAIGLPITSKDLKSFLCPTSMLTKLNDVFDNTTHLITVGWKGEENHFGKQFLSRIKNNIKITIVSASSDGCQRVQENIKKYIGKAEFTHFAQKFSGFAGNENAMSAAIS